MLRTSGLIHAAALILLGSTAESRGTVGVVAGDMDGDGDIDYLAANTSVSGADPLFDVYLNDGNGGFLLSSSVGSGFACSIAAADFDSDGVLDAVVRRRSAANTVCNRLAVYRGGGGGTFSQSQDLTVATTGMALLDADGDGDTDLMVVDVDSSATALLLNDGDGALSPTASPLLNGVAIGSADVDGDGDPDVVTAATGVSSTFTVYLNSGTGAFTPFGAPLTPTSADRPLVPGDLDGDGDIDFVAAAQGTGQAEVFLNDGAGNFSFGTPFGSVDLARDVALGDMDNDGDLDAVIAGGDAVAPWNGGNELWLNDGSATFSQSGTPTEEEDDTRSIALADTDADGDLDILAGNFQLSGGFSGDGAPNRHYANDQAATSPNTVPTAPGAGFGAAGSGQVSVAAVRLSWGAGADTETPASSLQYQLRVGTSSQATDVVSPETASPSYVWRVAPSTSSREYRLANLACGGTYYWSVATRDTGLRRSAFSAEQTFTLTPSCAIASGGGGAAAQAGGGGKGWWLTATPARIVPSVSAARITGHLFLDLNANALREASERSMGGGTLVRIAGKDASGVEIERTAVVAANGTFALDVPAGVYAVSVQDDGLGLAAYVPTTPPTIAGLALSETGASVRFGWRPRRLLAYSPCLYIGSVEEHPGRTVHQAVLESLRTIYGDPAVRTRPAGRLLTRREFMETLAATQCLRLRETGDALRDRLRQRARQLSLTQAGYHDLPVPDAAPRDPWVSAAYALLEAGIPAERVAGGLPVADAQAPVTRREAMAMVAAVLGLAPAGGEADGGSTVTLPPDATEDDRRAGVYAALDRAGLLPLGFRRAVVAGVTPSEGAELLLQAAFAAGKISVGEGAQESSWDPAATPEYLATAGDLPRRECLKQDAARATTLMSDILPGETDYLFQRLAFLLTVGTPDTEGRVRWLVTGRPSEYGVLAGKLPLQASSPVTWIDLLDTGLKFTCHPLETASQAAARMQGVGADVADGGTGNRVFVPDRLFGSADGQDFRTRVIRSVQRPIRQFDLTPIAFAPELFRAPYRGPDALVSVNDASRLLASFVLYPRVRAGAMTRLEAEAAAAALQAAILGRLTGVDRADLWRAGDSSGNDALTWRQLIIVLSDALGPELADQSLPPVPLAEAWQDVAGR